MSQHTQTQSTNGLNSNLVTLIFLVNFVVIGGMIFSNISIVPSKPADGVDVALVEPTITPLPSATPLPPTLTPTPIPTSTTQVAEDTAHNTDGHTAADYDPELAARGQVLFAQCAACHGADARGLPNLGKNLVDSEFLHSLTDEELVAFIKTGRPMWDPLNTTGIDMPPKGGNPALTDEDIMAIIAYIHSLIPPSGK